MPLEVATYIPDLNPLWPSHNDPANTLDAHERLTKQVVKATFPNMEGAMTRTPAGLNAVGAYGHAQEAVTPQPSSTQSVTISEPVNFTAPASGLLFCTAHFNLSNVQPSQCQGFIQVTGSSAGGTGTLWTDTSEYPLSGSGVQPVNAGDKVTVSANYTTPPSTATFATVSITVNYLFIPTQN